MTATARPETPIAFRARVTFDDLLAARVIHGYRPDLAGAMLQILLERVPGWERLSLCDGLVARGDLTREQASFVAGWVERYRRHRELGLFARLAVREGLPEGDIRAFLDHVGSDAEPAMLGQELVEWEQLSPERNRELLFQARQALDRDLQAQVEAFLAEHPEAPIQNVEDLPAEAVIHIPAGVQADRVLEEAMPLTRKVGPAFPIPSSIDTGDPLTGTRIGPYRVLGRIGRGGMGVVYLAAGEGGALPVAVKVLRANATPEERGRFRREVLAAGCIAHPGLLEVHASGELPDEREYLVMEYFAGGTLQAALNVEGRLPLSRALPVVQRLAEILAALHAAGVVHRDVKPANVLLGSDGDVRLIDFGLALLPEEEHPELFRSLPGTIIGTPDFMSPEQVLGEAAGPASDVYSCGLVLYELLSGRFPFEEGSTPYARVLEDPIPLAAARPWTACLPADLHELLAHMLRRDRDERPPAAEVAATLARLLPLLDP